MERISVFTLETVEIVSGSGFKHWCSTECFRFSPCIRALVFTPHHQAQQKYTRKKNRSSGSSSSNSNNNETKVAMYYRTIATLRHHYNCLACHCLDVCISVFFVCSLSFRLSYFPSFQFVVVGVVSFFSISVG